MFKRTVDQYEKMRKRNAYIDQYTREEGISKEDLFADFDQSREVVQGLIDEYVACESPDYITKGLLTE